ncbi:MAG: tyrosine-type recombinase/integrase [Candidatus Acidiferrum sp.]
MTFRAKKRGKFYRLEGRYGEALRRGSGERERFRLSLGTMNGDAAQVLVSKIDQALAEGPRSAKWNDLRAVLPPETFGTLAAIAGHIAEPETPKHTWKDLAAKRSEWMDRRVALDKLRDSTRKRYAQTAKSFSDFLETRGITYLDEVTREVVDEFKGWQRARALAKTQSRGGRGFVLDAAVLHGIFAYAVDELDWIVKNPVRMEGRPGDDADRGSQPFKPDELKKLRDAAGVDMLAFLLLRHTGLRGSDAVGLRWEEIDFDSREISRLTLKRRKRVDLPIPEELFFALEADRDRRKPQPQDRVLLNSTNGRPFTRPRLYERMVAIGRRAGVQNANPHRFRDTFAVDLLCKGASPYDVAKALGDVVATVEKHYAPFVPELRDRLRGIMDNGVGLEQLSGTSRAHGAAAKGRIN